MSPIKRCTQVGGKIKLGWTCGVRGGKLAVADAPGALGTLAGSTEGAETAGLGAEALPEAFAAAEGRG